MIRKIALLLTATALTLTLAAPAGAAAKRVKGKFRPDNPALEVLGSAKVKPLGGGVHRVGLTLQHVRRADYKVFVGSFVDGNGNGIPEPGELRGPTLVPGCDLSHPSRKGHAGCKGDVALEGVPYVALLGISQPDGSVLFEADAFLK